LAGIFIAYTGLGFLVCPLVLRSAMAGALARFLDRAVTIEGAQFNPYTLSLEFHGLKIEEAGGAAFLSVHRVRLSIDSVSSLLHRAPVFKEIAILEPRVSIVRGLDGRLNIDDLLALRLSRIPPIGVDSLLLVRGRADYRDDGRSKASSDATIRLAVCWDELRLLKVRLVAGSLRLSMGEAALRGARVSFIDGSVRPPERLQADRIVARLGPFSSTGPRLASFSACAEIGAEGRLQALGEFDPLGPSREARARILLQGLDLRALSPYAASLLGFGLSSGRLGIDLRISVLNSALSAHGGVSLERPKLGNIDLRKAAPFLLARLSIALLSDGGGRIKFVLPIGGSLAKPSFDLAKALLRPQVDPFTNPAASDFSMIGGAEELGFQEFLPGSSMLLRSGYGKLDAIVLGMRSHPRLVLDIEGTVDPVKDSGDLVLLAANRAQSVRAYLLGTGSLGPERIFIIEDSKEEVPRKGSRAILSLSDEYRGSNRSAAE
jgi:hypothetical protein